MDHFLDRVSFRRPEFRELIHSLAFLPNSPTLFNAGIPNAGSLSACFVLEVPDTMDGIFDMAKASGMIQKYGGGVGYCLSDIRPKDSPIRSTHGKACGPVKVMHHMHSVATLITQGGKRQGAQMAVLDATHPDVREFIHCKDVDPQSLSTFNISVRVTDSFMHKAFTESDSEESKLLWEIAESAWRTGDPGLIFADTTADHQDDVWTGAWRTTNPCGEASLPNFGSCNLGSINLMAVFDESTGMVNYDLLRHYTDLAVRYLDVVVNENKFPLPEIDRVAKLRRNLGLGVMGLADLLAAMKLDYDSDAGRNLAAAVWECVRVQAYATSEHLAELWGPAPAYNMPTADPNVKPRRNTTLLCIAPTGTISILAGVSSGIEPHYALENTRLTGDGMLFKEKVDSEFIPKTALEISWDNHIYMAAEFHNGTDTGVSKTINMPHDATVDDVWNAYLAAWSRGLMAVSLFRDGCRGEQILNAEACPECDEVAMVRRDGCTTCTKCGYSYCDL